MIYKIGDFLIRSKDTTTLEDNQYYQRVTVRLNHKGVVQRDRVLGSEIKTKRQFLVKSGQFIMSRIDARNGAFGIIPDELDGAIVTNDFLAFDIDITKVNLEYFIELIKSEQFIQFCIEGSTGTTNRKRLKEELFLIFQIEVPDMEKQDKIVNKTKAFKVKSANLKTELNQKKFILNQLKKSVLQEAIQGKLVKQVENDKPSIVLLEKIKEKKEQLIREKKIKNEKNFTEITEAEKPFELPKGWEWVRLQSLVKKIGAGSTPRGGKAVYVDSGIKFIRSQNVWNDGLYLDDIAFITEEINDKMLGSVVEPNDLLINITGASIGRCCIVPSDFDVGNVNQHVSIIRLVDNNETLRQYLHYCLISNYIQETIMSAQVGISREGLSISKLSGFLIPIPPLNEQKRIVEKLNKLMVLFNELELEIEKSEKESEKLTKAVLQEAFAVKEEILN